MGHLLMTGVWEDQIATDADPSKGRDDCCFFFVREVLMCTNITYTQKRISTFILVNQWTRLMNLNKLLKT
jgi:hypothetical protein